MDNSAGDVLLNITGASIGRVTQSPKELAGARVNQHVCIIRPQQKYLSAAFLSQYLASPLIQKMITSEEYGVTRQALTKQAILNFEIPLPPLNEQRRIVAKIEALKERSQKARVELEAAKACLAQLRQAVLAAAFRGDLTADWRDSRYGFQNDETQSCHVEEFYSHTVLAPECWKYYSVYQASPIHRLSQNHRRNCACEFWIYCSNLGNAI